MKPKGQQLRALRTERTRALTKVRQTREFLARASHEIRTPLHGIVGYTSLLLGTELTDEQRSLADALRAGVDSLLDVVNDVLDLSTLDAGALRIEPQEFDVLALVAGVARQFGPEAWAKGLDVRVETGELTRTGLVGDPGRLRQVLVNLVSNAVKYADAGGITIGVSTRTRGAVRGRARRGACELRIAVSDSGPGVPREARRRLFSPFSRLAPAGAPRKPGAGLGLAISRGLVELMEGRLTFTPGREGGSVFAFTVPVGEAAPSFVRESADLDVAKMRVYVADDDPLSRRELLMALTAEAIGVSGSGAAITLADALLAADQRGRLPHLVLVGHVRDAGADLEIASRLGGDARLARVPLVLVPVSGMRGHARAVREAGYAAYLPRPLRRGELKECVRAVLLRPAVPQESIARHAHKASAAPLLTRHRLADENRLPSAGRVLIVDDDPANRTVTRLQVERLGYPADTVENGAQAVAAVTRGNYQVVLMDCHMPTMNGLMATAEIRRLDAGTPGPAIVAVTAEAGEGWARRCREAGIDEVLEKPVRAHRLAEALARHARTPSRSADAQQIAARPPARSIGGIHDLVAEVGMELTLDLARDYLGGVRTAVERMRTAHIETTKADAHRLLGSARMLGLEAFETLWPRVEELASLYDRIPDDTVDELRRACIELESWIEGQHEKQRA